MVAIHAWRSADSIDAFRQRYPDRPLVVCLAGTDVYGFQHSHSEVTLRSFAQADRLLGLHDRVANDIPAAFRPKVRVVIQSAEPPPADLQRARGSGLQVAVVANMRDVKDPFRAALAAAALPDASTVEVVHVGDADEDWAARARAQMALTPRYRWLGSVPPDEARSLVATSDVLVVSSRSEGGANVVSEAAAAHTAVLASRISGNVGLLGARYDGYFDVGHTDQLRALLVRAEADPTFLGSLRQQMAALAQRVQPAAEGQALRSLLAELGVTGRSASAPRSPET